MSNETIKKNFLDNIIFFLKHNIKTVIILLVIVFISLLIGIFYNDLNKKKILKFQNNTHKRQFI